MLKDVLDVTLIIGNDALTEKIVGRKFTNSNHVLPIGQTTHIKYEAKDEAGNEAYCTMEITLQG